MRFNAIHQVVSGPGTTLRSVGSAKETKCDSKGQWVGLEQNKFSMTKPVPSTTLAKQLRRMVREGAIERPS